MAATFHDAGSWLLLGVAVLAFAMLVGSARDLTEGRRASFVAMGDAQLVLERSVALHALGNRLAVGEQEALATSSRELARLSAVLADRPGTSPSNADAARREAIAVSLGWQDVARRALALRLTRAELAGAGESGRSAPALRRRFAAEAEQLHDAADALARATIEHESRASEAVVGFLVLRGYLLLATIALALVVLLRRLQQSKRREARALALAMVPERLASAILIADSDGRVEWVNSAFERLAGWPACEAMGKPLAEWFVAPGDASQWWAPWRGMGPGERREARLLTRDGRETWVSMEIAVVPADVRHADRHVIAFDDVTEARAERLALAEHSARFRSALAAMTEGLVVQGQDGAILACNSAAERILGLSESQMAGRTCMDPRWRAKHEDGSDFPGEEHPAVVALRTGKSSSGVIMGVHRPDGGDAWISIEANPIREGGVVTGVVTTFLDVTARRRADADMAKLREAIEQGPTACMITNANRELEYVNPSFERLTGWKSAEILGRNPRVLGSGQTPQATYDAMWSALERGERWQGELVNHRRDGTPYRTRILVFPLRNEHHQVTHYVAHSEDVTEERRQERELQKAREEALAAARAKSEFLRNMSHELRTPMNGILGMAELLAQTDLSAAQRSDLATLRSSADQLLTVISQLFDFTRLGDGTPDRSQVPFLLRQSLAPVRNRLATGAESRGLRWSFDVSPGLPEAFRGDPGGLRQVLLHLVDNALKFTPRGEVTLRVTEAAHAGPSTRVRFEVQDTGIGIPTERQEAIFEAFEQGDGTSTRPYGGVGLGLTVARLIAARMDGQLEVTSEPGLGATFAFEVALESLPSEEAAGLSMLTTATGALEGARVVLVDGGGAMRDRSFATLEAAGAQVEAVPGPEAAIALVREAHGDRAVRALVLDERGGGFDAFPVAQRLHEVLGDAMPPTVFVAVTGQRGDAERCRALGISGYLSHPVGDADLREAVEHVIEAPASGRGASPASLVTRHVLRERRRAIRLLLVEDNAVNRKVATRMLERSGFVVTVAEDGREGVERFREGGWDVVLMDIQMPVMDGIEATRTIRAWEAERGLERTPIIAVTAHTLDDDRTAAHAAGMDGFVGKPISPDELLGAIHRLVRVAPEDVAEDSGPPAIAEVLDWSEALERMDGDEGVLRELLRLFLQDSEHMTRRLEEARASGDLHQLERAAHGVKGASATISARAVAPLALEIEQLARHGEAVKAIDRMQDLRVELQRLRRALEALPQPGRKAA